MMLAPFARAERPRAQDRPAIWSGVYTAGQAERGKAVYASHCSRCHGDDLGKNRSYPLAGEGFMDHWEASTLERLFNQIRQMPPGAPAAVNDADRRDAMAYLLQQNGFPEGRTDLTSDEAILETMQIVGRNGPAPLKTGTVVRVAGCLAQRSEREWELTGATEPERTALPAAPGVEPPRPNTITEGNRTVALMNAFPNPAAHQGHMMLAVGFLVRTPDGDALNVVSLEMLATRCAP
jgi:mono/diheme cytochrome c family protein